MTEIRHIRLAVLFTLLTGLAGAIAAGAQPNRISTYPALGAAACCSIVSIDANSGLIEAKVNSTEQLFAFTLANKVLVSRLRAGQVIYANLGNRQVSLDGKTVTGTIVRFLQPGRIVQNNPGSTSGSPSTGSSGGSSSDGPPSVDSSALAAAQTAASMITRSRTVTLTPQCSGTYTLGCPNGVSTWLPIQLDRHTVIVTPSANGNGGYAFSATMSAVTPAGVPFSFYVMLSAPVATQMSCTLTINTAWSSPLSISGILNITTNTSGQTPIYKVSLSNPVTSSSPGDFSVSDCTSNVAAPINGAMLNTLLSTALYGELFWPWAGPMCFKSENIVPCPT